MRVGLAAWVKNEEASGGFVAFTFFERRGDAAEGRGLLDSDEFGLPQ
jgi:hypothetical protein